MIARYDSVRFFALLVVCSHVAGAPHGANGALIASFQDEFQLTTPAPGWSYLWNNSGEIGNPANYTALLPNSSGFYTSGGTDTLPAPDPAGVINFNFVIGIPGGHPGPGTTQGASGGIERYAIATFTLASSDLVAIHNSSIITTNPNSGGSTDGLNIKVFINNSATPAISTATPPGVGSTATFDGFLGALNAGDKIYVAVGSRGEDLFDSFRLGYDIESVPEPASMGLAVLAIANLMVIAVRQRSR